MQLRPSLLSSARAKRVWLMLPLLAVLGARVSAKADTYDYTITQGSNTATFSLSSTATPSSDVVGSGFVYDNIAVTVNGAAPVTQEVGFSNTFDQLAIADSITFTSSSESTTGTLFETFGPGLYTGPENDPTLSLGMFSSSLFIAPSGFISGPGTANGATITVEDVTTVIPEPSSLALLGTSVLGFAGMLRRRFVK
jgi:hypothetical protein